MRMRTRRPAIVGLATLAVASLVGALVALPAGADPAADGPSATPAPAPPSSGAAAPDGRLLVTMDPGSGATTTDAVVAATGASIEGRAGDTLILSPPAGGTLRAGQAATIPGVTAVEPDYAVTSFSAPNDPLYPDQYGLANTQPGGIRAESAWNDTTGSRDVVVGVLDSGAALSHPDLTANLWTNRTGINGCAYGTHGWNAIVNSCTPSDDAAHGSHVSGIIGATGNNSQGVTGVAQRVSMMPLKMLDASGNGYVADAVEAIDFALSAKAAGVNLRALNASWGTDVSSVALSAAIGRANDAGVLFVAAAGNGRDALHPTPIDLDLPGNDIYPCEDSHTNVVCVGASTSLATLAPFSNWGANAVDIAAPGENIVSTIPTGVAALVNDPCFTAQYCEFSGTSMATPMVTGAAVVALAAEPDLTLGQLRSRLLTSVTTFPGLDGLVATGRLDVCKAVPNCGGLPSIAPTKPNAVTASVGNGSVHLTWAKPDSNGNSFTIIGYDVEGPAGITSLPLTATGTTLTGLTNNVNATIRVRAVGASNGPWVDKVVRPYGGGLEVDGLGGLHRLKVGGLRPSAPRGGPYFPADLARGVAIVPEGTGGYVVDAYGGLHRFRIGAGSPLPRAATGGPYWVGWDIVRGVALSPSGGGYLLDGYGALHPFGEGPGAPPAKAKGTPYWLGWDIARGVTLTDDGSAGYELDGFGGIHRFRIGGASSPPIPSGAPYWLGWDIARGITTVNGSGGGWILDGFGGIHPFATGGSAPAQPKGTPYWLGWDIARGIDA